MIRISLWQQRVTTEVDLRTLPHVKCSSLQQQITAVRFRFGVSSVVLGLANQAMFV